MADGQRLISRRQLFYAGGALLLASGFPGCPRKNRFFLPATGVTSAERAINAAKRFAGITLNIGWEMSEQTQDLLRYSGPLWERLTGIRINVVELGIPTDMFRRVSAEHRAKTGALDCAMVAPSWMPSLLNMGALEPLDDYVQHYMVQSDLKDLLPLYQSLGVYDGCRYGLFDDGDTLLLYYRRDLFEDPKNKKDFAVQFGRPLGDPRYYNWQEFLDAAKFFTDKYAPNLYGMAPFTKWLRWGWFQTVFRNYGGQFFDGKTMKPGVNGEPGVRAMNDLAQMDKFIAPGAADVPELSSLLQAYISGKAAMATFWPPLGRWAEVYGGKPFGSLTNSKIAGKTGYALLPGGRTEMAVGWLLVMFANCRHKEAAYLFLQWLNSPEISLQRVMLSYSLRDPFRKSHIESAAYRSLWPTAPDYLDTLKMAADKAYLDLTIPGSPEYEETFYEAASDVRLGSDIKSAMDKMAKKWEKITETYGRSRQLIAYKKFLQQQGAK